MFPYRLTINLIFIIFKYLFHGIFVPMTYRIDEISNRSGRPTILLRRHWREGKRIRKETIANLTRHPGWLAEGSRSLVDAGTGRAGRDGRAQLPHPARRSLDRRSERRLRRRIRKLQAGRDPDAHAAEGIRSPRRQSEEHVPKGWQVGTGEPRSCKGKLALLRREVQVRCRGSISRKSASWSQSIRFW